MNMFGKFGKITEGQTRNELNKRSKVKDTGFESSDQQPTNFETV